MGIDEYRFADRVAKEFVIDKQRIPRMLKAIDENGAVRDVDLFADLAPEGVIEVVIHCAESGQYYGMAAADTYILDRDGQFSATRLQCCCSCSACSR